MPWLTDNYKSSMSVRVDLSDVARNSTATRKARKKSSGELAS